MRMRETRIKGENEQRGKRWEWWELIMCAHHHPESSGDETGSSVCRYRTGMPSISIISIVWQRRSRTERALVSPGIFDLHVSQFPPVLPRIITILSALWPSSSVIGKLMMSHAGLSGNRWEMKFPEHMEAALVYGGGFNYISSKVN